LILSVIGLGVILFSSRRIINNYEKLKQQAIHDTLTGIPNRVFFDKRIFNEYNRSLRNHQPISIIMGDIDNFKNFNDTYGHIEGDLCLQKVAKAIFDTLKRPGDFCARFGGEEFIIILPETPDKGAMKIAEEIRMNILALEIIHAGNFPVNKVTMSLGVTSINADQVKNYDEMIRLADAALYDAKEKGRNRVEERHLSVSQLNETVINMDDNQYRFGSSL